MIKLSNLVKMPRERQEGKNEEKTDRSKGRNHPPQSSQLVRVWGKKKRIENKKEERQLNKKERRETIE